MPGTSKAKSPSGVEITFEELTHTYSSKVNGKAIDYVSGTVFLHKFFPEFDPTGEITKRCAKKQGVTVEELKKQWAQKGLEATTFGTRCHEVCEDIETMKSLGIMSVPVLKVGDKTYNFSEAIQNIREIQYRAED